MATTITVQSSTRRMLELVKEKKKAKTFDELLSDYASKQLNLPKSMKGAVKFLDSQIARDKIDRY